MSYDVQLKTPNGPRCQACDRFDHGRVVYDQNMTSNVSGIWYRALMAALGKTVPLRCDDIDGRWTDKLGAFGPLTGMTGGDAIPVLERAADHIEAWPEVYKPFEPANGWGDAKSAARFLREMSVAWKAEPTAVLSVSR